MDQTKVGEWRPCGQPWYAVKVRTRAEERVGSSIQTRDVAVYVPTYLETRRYADRLKKASVALFPGYVFCGLDIKKRLPVLMVPGVEYFVTFEGEPKPVAEEEIAAIDTALRSGLPASPCQYLEAGDRVRVEVGSMSGVEGILVQEKSKNRLVISVHLLRRSMSVEIDRDWVVPLGKQPGVAPGCGRSMRAVRAF
jgi:transcription antitermination factor NusG